MPYSAPIRFRWLSVTLKELKEFIGYCVNDVAKRLRIKRRE